MSDLLTSYCMHLLVTRGPDCTVVELVAMDDCAFVVKASRLWNSLPEVSEVARRLGPEWNMSETVIILLIFHPHLPSGWIAVTFVYFYLTSYISI